MLSFSAAMLSVLMPIARYTGIHNRVAYLFHPTVTGSTAVSCMDRYSLFIVL